MRDLALGGSSGFDTLTIDYLDDTINEYQHLIFSVVWESLLVTDHIILITSHSIPKYTS